MQGDPLPPAHHVLRYVAPNRIRRGNDDVTPIGIHPEALQLRLQADGTYESYLSVQWVEHVPGVLDTQIAAAINSLRKTLTPKKTSIFAMANTGAVESICREHSPLGPVRIAHEPEVNNEAHAGIHNFPREVGQLQQILVSTAFALRLIRNQDIP